MSGDHAQERTRTRQLAKLGALFAGFAHEIRNPLSTIGLNLQLVKEDFGEAESPRDRRIVRRLTVVESEVKRLQSILEEFLGFVRIPVLDLAPTRLDALVEEVVEFTGPEMAERGIELRALVDTGVEPVPADASQIRAVLANLIRNAAEAMPDGGQIIVQLRSGPDAAILRVTDTGPGMPADVRERAFEPYFSTKQAGTGLGLPTVRRVVEQHGGTIDLVSEEGKGTQFSIRLPREPATDGGELES